MTTVAGKPLSEEVKRAIGSLVDTYPERRTALLPALKLAQEEVGYLPPETIAQVADLVGVPHAAAYELVQFYNMLHVEPLGSVEIVVCAQLPCALRGASRLLRELSEGLGVEPNATSADGRVTLERTSECFGACHRAPMARVNGTYRENLDPAATAALVAQIRESVASGPRTVQNGGAPNPEGVR